MAESKIIASISRGQTEELRVAISEYKGKQYLDLRIFYTTDDGATWNPTKKGVTVSPDNLQQFKEAIEEAQNQLAE